MLVGVPLGRPGDESAGCDRGPAALRQALGGFGTYRGEPDGDLRTLGAVIDWGDLEVAGGGPAALRTIHDAAARLFGMGARPIFAGGAHALTRGVLSGLAAGIRNADVALLVLDAHLDAREEEDALSLGYGTPFSATLRADAGRGARTAVVGLRPFANSRMFTEWMRESGVHLVMVDDVARWGVERTVEVVLERIAGAGRGLYLSIDLDVVDPAHAPGAAHVCPGGLSSREIITFVHALVRRAPLIGADITELAPALDSGGRTAKLAARLVLEVLAGFAARRPAGVVS